MMIIIESRRKLAGQRNPEQTRQLSGFPKGFDEE
jgi:hypothetical protein